MSRAHRQEPTAPAPSWLSQSALSQAEPLVPCAARGLPFREEFPHTYGCLISTAKWGAFYAVIVPLAMFFPVMMFGFMVGFVCAGLLAAWEIGGKASADTLPQGQDAQQGLAGTESGAVGSEASETPNPSPSPAAGR